YTLSTVVEEDPENPEAAVAVIEQGFVILKTDDDETLAAEGAARDVIRAVQSARRDAQLDVSDRIATVITGPQPVIDAIAAHEQLISSETLSLQVTCNKTAAPDPRDSVADDATKTVEVTVQKADAYCLKPLNRYISTCYRELQKIKWSPACNPCMTSCRYWGTHSPAPRSST